ncbi:MAG: hypothetical protein NZ929_01780 [Aigarchaeota archaeon]|nr:hypothetical protein [Aigarchaeota archaeon]
MSSLRLKLPGAVFFASNIYSLFTGLAFTVIVTRSLTISDFGLWTMVSQYIAYTAVPLSSLVSFWIVRYVARGFKQAPKSGLIFSLILSFIGLLFYMLVALIANISFSQPLVILLLAAPQALTYIILGSLTSIAIGISPIHVGISSMVFETLKVVLACFLVRIFYMGLTGAIVSVILAQFVQVIYLLIAFREYVKNKSTDYNLLRKWFKLSWLPVYELFSGVIGGLDVLMARIISTTDALIGVKNVAGIAGSFPRYASSLTLSLYPRSLRTSNSKDWEKDIEESLKLMYFVSIPITFGNIILMDLILGVFGKGYVDAYMAGIVLSVASFIGLINSVTEPVLRGSETIDMKDEVVIKEYLMSRIFKLITINHISAITYLTAVGTTLVLFTGDIYQTTFYWSLASFTGLPFTLYKVRMVKEIGLRFRLPIRNILHYLLSSLFMILLVYCLKGIFYTNFTTGIVGVLSRIASLTIIGGCFYFIVTLLIDDYARKILVQAISLLKRVCNLSKTNW